MYRVGVLQYKPQLLQVEANLARLEIMLKNVQADLIVLPELAASGYVFKSQQEVDDVAEPFGEGPTSQVMTELAIRNNCSIIIGYPEKGIAGCYNSAMLINPDGSKYNYQKTHLFAEEKKYFLPGESGLNVFSAKDGVNVGIMICFDWQFPEAARTLALRGAQILCHPSNLVLPWCQQAMLTRSLENRVFSVTANRIGLERNGDKELYFTGMSQVVSTKGEILIRLTEDTEEVSIIEIDPRIAFNKTVTDYNDAFADRRSSFYQI